MYIDKRVTEDVIFMLRQNLRVIMLQEVTEQLIIIIIIIIITTTSQVFCKYFRNVCSIRHFHLPEQPSVNLSYYKLYGI
jgi:hypothetical protein